MSNDIYLEKCEVFIQNLGGGGVNFKIKWIFSE